MKTATWWIVFAVLLAAVAGYWYGARRQPTPEVSGLATVGDRHATIEVEGWRYSVTDSVQWIGADSTLHPDGWPACLTTGTDVPVKFGWVPVTMLTTTTRTVVYVDCRA